MKKKSPKKPPARIRKPEEALYHLVEVLDVLRLGVDTYKSGRTSTWMIISAYLHQLLVDKTNGNRPLATRVIPSLKLHPMYIDISSTASLMQAPFRITDSGLDIFDWKRPRIPLDDWLKQVAYIQPQNQHGVPITLEDLIQMPRHQAGSVHFDEEIGDAMCLIEGVLTFVRVGDNQLSYRDYLMAIGDYIQSELNSDLMGCLGNGYVGQGNYPKAKEFLQTAINLSRAVGNSHLLCEQLADLGRLHYHLQELSQSEKCYKEALSICQSISDQEMVFKCQRSLAIIYLGLGNELSNIANDMGAINYYKTALALSRAIGDRAHEIILLSNLGIVYERLGIIRNSIAIWLIPLLLDLDIDELESTDAGPVQPIIEKVVYNLLTARKNESNFDAIVKEILTNWKQIITESTAQEYTELESLDIELVSRNLVNMLENTE